MKARETAVDYGGLEDSVGFHISIAQAKVFRDFQQHFAGQPLSPGAISALIIIYHNPGIRHGVLAKAVRIKLAHMTKLIKSFERQGFVCRKSNANDRRIVALSLTENGRRYVEEMAPQVYAHDSSRADGLTPPERQALVGLLKKLNRI